ncbi:MAG: response regulator [Proteobacteria bacterium]|nr:response regulator [Pseudomonadota bacterium]
MVEPLRGVSVQVFGPAGQDALVLAAQEWELTFLVDLGLLDMYLRRRSWRPGRADALQSAAVPRTLGELQPWARRQAAHGVLVLTSLEGGEMAAAPRLRLLVVDDEDILLRGLERLLQKQHEVHCYTEPVLALELAQGGDFDGILCDVVMPRLDGLRWLSSLRDVRPDLARRTCLMTAEPHRLGETSELVLSKPMSLEDLDEIIRLFAVLRGPPR